MTTGRSPAWRLFILMIGAAALLSLAAACGGDDDDSNGNGDSDGSATATMSDGEGNITPSATTDDGDGNGGGSSLADLAAFGSDYESFNGKVTYNITDFAAEGGVGSMTLYQKDGSSRFDIASDTGDISFISTPEASYLCSEGQCLQYPADDDTANASVDAFADIFSADSITENINDIPDGVDVDVSNETIAGLDATCFTASGDLDPDQVGDESSQFCFSDGGLLLRLAFEGAGESGSFEATAASGDVPDSDFEPPFPVIDFSDLFQTP